MQVMKRLLSYAAFYKRTIFLGLLMLTIAVAAELSGPFIAKRMIDVNILGIEKPWYESARADQDAVPFEGRHYKREARFAEGEVKGPAARVLQVGTKFVFIPGAVATEGERRLEGDRLTITRGGESAVYPARVLSGAELYTFYKPEIRELLKLMGLYFGLLIVASIFTYGQKYLLQTSSNKVVMRLRNDVFAHMHRLPVNYFDNIPAGKIVSRITNDTEAVKDLFVSVLANFVTAFIYMIGIFVALSLLDIRLTFFWLFLVPVLVGWVYVYRNFATRFNRKIRSLLSELNGMINEAIQGMPIIRAFGRQKQTEGEFEALNQEYFRNTTRLMKLNAITGFNLTNFLRNMIFIALIWYFGADSLHGMLTITVGVLYAFVDYINRLFQPITGMVNQLAQLDTALVSAERVFELLDEPGIDVAAGSIPRYKGDVSFKNVWFAYKDEEYVLKNISFEAKRGETVALVGHTGSGKSSILNLLFRFYDPQRGSIEIDGVKTKDIPRQKLRRHMGIVLQDPFLFTGTIAANVSLGDPAITRDKVESALSDVGAERILQHLPKGYDEPVLEKGSTLSAGQRQLISFARALAFDPAILILDEATANIDTETEAIIQDALEVVKQGRTTFIIAHRLSTIRKADKILVLHRGEIVESGSHESLMLQRGRYFQMYQLQQGGGAGSAATGNNEGAAARDDAKAPVQPV